MLQCNCKWLTGVIEQDLRHLLGDYFIVAIDNLISGLETDLTDDLAKKFGDLSKGVQVS